MSNILYQDQVRQNVGPDLGSSLFAKVISRRHKLPLATFSLLVSSADNLCKQFGPRPGLTKSRAWSGDNLFDTWMIFLKEFFEKVDFEKKKKQTSKSMQITHGAELIMHG